MQTQEFDALAKEIIGQQDHINRYLGKAARVCTKFRSPTEDDDLPGTLLVLAKEEQNWLQQSTSSDSVDRPREEDIDNFFSAIRARPTTVRSQRQGSLKKSAASLHQSRVLTEHNPAVVANTSTSSSCSNVSTVGSKSMSARHSSPVDLEALVVRFRQAISTLEQIDNAPFEEIDLTEVHHFYRQEWSTVVKSFEQVDNLLIQFQQQVEAERRRDRNYQPIIKKELIESMERVQSTLHDVCYVKGVENLPDLKTTVSEEAFALSECLDLIDETIRQKHL